MFRSQENREFEILFLKTNLYLYMKTRIYKEEQAAKLRWILSLFICLAGVPVLLPAQNLRLHYALTQDAVGAVTVTDETDNGNDATLKNGAKVSVFETQRVIDLGTSNGYADMGAGVGTLIASLRDFTIHTKIFIPATSNITAAGNFVWTFSNAEFINSQAVGCMFLSAKESRYSITQTDYKEESTLVGTKTGMTKGKWLFVTVVQEGTLARLYLDGILAATANLSLFPADLGATRYNWLGRACYQNDAYLKAAKIADFRIYEGALDAAEVAALTVEEKDEVNLKVHFDFSSLTDATGNYTGSAHNGATLTEVEELPVLSLGAKNGYFDLGAKVGEVIAQLDQFTVSSNLYIPSATALGGNGNFIWTFSNSTNTASDRNGCAFMRANDTRYAITTTYYAAEKEVTSSSAFPKGSWHNLTYTQSRGKAMIYVDGMLVARGELDLSLSDLGTTRYHFLGRPNYAGDVYLKDAFYHDFRIYEGALSPDSVKGLCRDLSILNKSLYREEIAAYMASLELPGTVRENVGLPTATGNGIRVSWGSSDENVVSPQGVVLRPAPGEPTAVVTLTALFEKGGVTASKEYELRIEPYLSDAESVKQDLENLVLTGTENIYESVSLPYQTLEGSVIRWKSSDPDYLSPTGKVRKLSPNGEGKKELTLTATARKGACEATRDFTVYVAEDEGYSAYLFAYFTGNSSSQEQIRFALSLDGFNYTPLHNGDPVISSDTIARKRAVRDPHILRGEDGKTFYMVVTDMKSSEGWSSNDGLVLLQSTDLLNWTHTAIDFPDTWPARFDRNALTQVWAPQTIYDPVARKYMVYYSIGESGQHYKIYYSYANDEFTELTQPEVLYDHGSNTIDADIVYKEGLYHLFFKTEGEGNGIQKATATTLQGPWTPHRQYLQQTTVAVEGSGVFKKINSDEWILMYDCYGSGYYQFCKSQDLEHFTWVCNTSTSTGFSPRHGTTLPLTSEEAERLVAKWPSSGMSFRPMGARNPAVRSELMKINTSRKTLFIPVEVGTDLSAFDPQLYAFAGTAVSPSGEQDFLHGGVDYTFTLNDRSEVYTVTAGVYGNPILPDFHADPEIVYSQKTGRFYLYSTTDGYSGWGGYYFNVFSSSDLVNWSDEGTVLDLSTDQVGWADGNAWAPCIEERMENGNYKYYFYYSGNTSTGKQIGVAVSNSPTGPFIDSGSSIINTSPTGSGQQIDPDVFTDPVSGKSYIYWGNGYLAGAERNEDWVSLKEGTTTNLTPSGGTLATYAYREGVYVFYRNGKYYFLWSVDDTGSTNYHVAYGTSSSPLGPITVAKDPLVIIQDAANEIYGTGHNSILQIPGRDEWYIVYHRIHKAYLENGPGYHREVCIDRLSFNEDGTIRRVTPTHRGVDPVDPLDPNYSGVGEIAAEDPEGVVTQVRYYTVSGIFFGEDEQKLPQGLYIRESRYSNGKVRSDKVMK